MTVLPLLYVFLLARSLIFINAKKIMVGKGENDDSCIDCENYTSLLEGIDASFQSSGNVTLELSDFEYQLTAGDIAQYLMKFSNRSLIFENPGEEKNKIISIMGRRSGLKLSKIIFHDEIFSFSIKNLLQFQVENIHFLFLRQNKKLLGCLICSKETENSFHPTILKLNFLNFECQAETSISLEERDYSLIDFEGYNFSISLESINIHIQKIGHFQNFLKISGIVPTIEFGFSNRFIGVKDLVFTGGESITIVRNNLKNLNFIFESSSFNNVKAFEIIAHSAAIEFVNCAFLFNHINQWLILENVAPSFIFIKYSNITITNSTCNGNYILSNPKYTFFISERSRAIFLNIHINEINIGEVNLFQVDFYEKKLYLFINK
jgi:hypothetical protein